MRWTIIVDKRASKEISALDKPMRLRVIDLIDGLKTGDPRSKGKGLTGDKVGMWSYRLGSYRILADIEDKTVTITVVKVDHRSRVYD